MAQQFVLNQSDTTTRHKFISGAVSRYVGVRDPISEPDPREKKADLDGMKGIRILIWHGGAVGLN